MKLGIDEIARVVHQVNKAYCESIRDYSQQDWEQVSEEHKISCMDAVCFHMENDATPEQSHNNWMNHKFNNDWTYGTTKDEERKEHPCLIPYYQLPQDQQSKDYLVKAIVKVLMDI